MNTYTCNVCGYEYIPAEGDTAHGVPAGTAFDNVSDDWCCPVCGVDKSQFSAE